MSSDNSPGRKLSAFKKRLLSEVIVKNWVLNIAMVAALSGSMSAEDKHKEKVKVETKDSSTGETLKHESSVKAESDGDYKSKSRTKVNGDTVEKRKVKRKSDGDYKEEVKGKAADGKYKSTVKVDK